MSHHCLKNFRLLQKMYIQSRIHIGVVIGSPIMGAKGTGTSSLSVSGKVGEHLVGILAQVSKMSHGFIIK